MALQVYSCLTLHSYACVNYLAAEAFVAFKSFAPGVHECEHLQGDDGYHAGECDD